MKANNLLQTLHGRQVKSNLHIIKTNYNHDFFFEKLLIQYATGSLSICTHIQIWYIVVIFHCHSLWQVHLLLLNHKNK